MSFSGVRLRSGARQSCQRFARGERKTRGVGLNHQEELRADPRAPRRSRCERPKPFALSPSTFSHEEWRAHFASPP